MSTRAHKFGRQQQQYGGYDDEEVGASGAYADHMKSFHVTPIRSWPPSGYSHGSYGAYDDENAYAQDSDGEDVGEEASDDDEQDSEKERE